MITKLASTKREVSNLINILKEETHQEHEVVRTNGKTSIILVDIMSWLDGQQYPADLEGTMEDTDNLHNKKKRH